MEKSLMSNHVSSSLLKRLRVTISPARENVTHNVDGQCVHTVTIIDVAQERKRRENCAFHNTYYTGDSSCSQLLSWKLWPDHRETWKMTTSGMILWFTTRKACRRNRVTKRYMFVSKETNWCHSYLTMERKQNAISFIWRLAYYTASASWVCQFTIFHQSLSSKMPCFHIIYPSLRKFLKHSFSPVSYSLKYVCQF